VATSAVAGRQTAERLRAIVLGPRGGGTTRRRASDAFRLGFAAAGVAVSIPVIRANSAIELSIVHALSPPPTAIRWLVTAVFWGGSVGVAAALAVVGLLVPRLAAVRRIAVAVAVTWVLCVLLEVALGPAAGRPATSALAGVDTSYPVTQLAITIAVAATALPYLSRSFHRLVSFLVGVAAIAAIVDGSALPVNAASSLLLGWGVAAGLHLAAGSPLGLLFLASIGFAAGTFHAPANSGGHQKIIWIVVGVVLAAGIAAALISVIPRLRRLASARVRPHLVHIWADVKAIATEPRKIVYVLAGSVLSQLLVALALGAALHSVGEKASIATLLVVITLASMIGGAVPVPGGAGVVEAGLIAGLTSAGVPQDQAVAAVFIQRLFTAYLPPIWGWVTLAWMRRREYV